MSEIKGKVVNAFIWKFSERIGAKGIQFIIQIILARLLSPEDYGTVALLTVFISFSNILIQGGFNAALIQKKEADELDFSSIFVLCFGLSVVLYAILFLSAPFIAKFYREESLAKLLRVMAIVLFPGAITSIQYAYVSRTLQLKKYSLCCIVSSLLSGVCGVIFAYGGCGVWSLIIQQILANMLNMILLLRYVDWKPRWKFTLKRIHGLFSYGWKVMVAGILNTAYTDIFNLVVGRCFKAETLGYYNRGNQYPQMLSGNLNESIQGILFPVLSQVQNDVENLKRTMRRGLQLSMFVILPMMLGLLVVAKPVIRLTLTDKWLPAVPFLQMSCIIYALYPFHAANIQTLKAMGRSDLFLRLEVIKKVIELSVLFLTIHFGIITMMLGQIFTSVISAYINCYLNKRLIDYGLVEQLKDIGSTMRNTIIMCISVVLVGTMDFGMVWTMILQIVAGIVIYVLLGYLTKDTSFFYLCQILKKMRLTKKKK